MKISTVQQLKKRIRLLLSSFIILLLLSGITAFPIETELEFIVQHKSWMPYTLQLWLTTIYKSVEHTNAQYPYLAYGTDWLAFAHIVIAVVFWGPLKDPVRNIWIIQFGMIACIMIFPLAFIAGAIRHIPFYWQLIDCSFGIIGFFLLYIIHQFIKQLETLTTTK